MSWQICLHSLQKIIWQSNFFFYSKQKNIIKVAKVKNPEVKKCNLTFSHWCRQLETNSYLHSLSFLTHPMAHYGCSYNWQAPAIIIPAPPVCASVPYPSTLDLKLKFHTHRFLLEVWKENRTCEQKLNCLLPRRIALVQSFMWLHAGSFPTLSCEIPATVCFPRANDSSSRAWESSEIIWLAQGDDPNWTVNSQSVKMIWFVTNT